MAITKQRYTLADLLDLPPHGNDLYELLGGELVVFSSPVEPHAAAVVELVLLLGAAQRAGFGQVRTAPRSVAFDYAAHGMHAEDVTMPDVLFVREARRAILGHRCVEAAPDLIVEVLSPSTRELDLPGGDKFAIYEQYGVAYYWVVDLDMRTITQFTWHDGHYGAPVVLRARDALTCPLFPGITRTVAEVFGELR